MHRFDENYQYPRLVRLSKSVLSFSSILHREFYLWFDTRSSQHGCNQIFDAFLNFVEVNSKFTKI